MGQSFKEQRRFGRKPVVLSGLIEVPLRPPTPCLIHNLSVDGALIEVGEAGRLPAFFHLRIESAGLYTRCDVIHRDGGNFVGVVFEGGSKNAAQSEVLCGKADKSAPASSHRDNSAFRKHLQRRLT